MPSRWIRGAICPDAAVVATDTVTVDGVAASVTEGGDTVQVDRAGAPVQVNDTLPLKPEEAATLKVYVAVWPADTDAVVGDVGATAKSGVDPESDANCGLAVALSVTIKDALLDPDPVGLKMMLTEQEAAGANVDPQVLFEIEKSLALAPDIEIPPDPMLSEAAPVFVNCTVCGLLEEPWAWTPKLKTFGERTAVVEPAEVATASESTAVCVAPAAVATT